MKQNTFKSLAFGGLLAVMAGSAQAVLIGDGSGRLYDYEVNTNTYDYIGNSGRTMFDIALDPLNDILYGVANGTSLYTIDQTNASATFVGNLGYSVNGLTFGSNGTLYGSGGSSLYTINTGTGSASRIGSGGYSSSGDIAFDDLGNLYLSSTTGPNNSLWLLDETTGAGTLLGDIGFNGVYGLNYSNDILYGFTSSGYTLSINTSTGAGTYLSTNGIGAYGADGVGGVAEVSEPAVLAFFGLGLMGLGFSRRAKASNA